MRPRAVSPIPIIMKLQKQEGLSIHPKRNKNIRIFLNNKIMENNVSKLELAKKFNGITIKGKQYFSRAIAEQVTGLSRVTLSARCRTLGIKTYDDCGKVFFDRQQIIEAIEKGLLDKRQYNKYKKI